MKRRLIITVWVSWFLCLHVTFGAEINLSPTLWQTTHGGLGPTGETLLVSGGFNGAILIHDDQGHVRRTRDVDGLPFGIVLADIDGRVGDEIVAAVLDARGSIRAFDGQLNPLWQYDDDQTFLSLGIGDLDHDGQKEIVAGTLSGLVYALDHRGGLLWKETLSAESSVGALAVGDLDGVPGDEIVAGTEDGQLFVLDGTGSISNRFVPEPVQGRGKQHHKFVWVREIQIDDIDGDGQNEIAVGSRPSGMVTVLNGRGNILWQRVFDGVVNSWSNSQITIGNVTGDSKKEIVCLLHGIVLNGPKNTTPVIVLDHRGEVIGEFFPPVEYMGISTLPREKNYDSIVVGSSARSPGCQILPFNALSSVQSNASDSKTDVATDQMANRVARMPRSPEKADNRSRPIHILHHVSYGDGIDEIERFYRFLRSRESDNLVFEMMVDGLREEADKRKGHKLPKRFKKNSAFAENEILSFSADMEKRQIPFYIRLAKNNHFHLTPETVENILITSPRFCKGFVVNECSYTRKRFDKFVDSLGQVLEILRRQGKRKLILNQHFDFWAKIPADPQIAQKLFRPEFREVLVPMYKTNRPHGPELNMAMIAGLWKSGIVDEWGYCAQDDLWKFESIFMNPPSDVILRMEVMAASLGATYYRIEGNRQFVEKKGENYVVEEESRRHRDLFHSLVRKGVLVPLANREQLVTSPVLFLRRFNPEEMPRPGESHDSYWNRVFQRRDILSYDFALKRVRDSYLPRLWTGMQNYVDGVFPGTPYGFVCFAPDWIGAAGKGWASQVFVTDGKIVVHEKGSAIPAVQINNVILESLKSKGKELPFTTDDHVFLGVNKHENGNYSLCLMDTGQFDVHDIHATLRINLDNREFRVIDGIDGSVLTRENDTVSVTIPGGLFRLLKVVLL
jgi:hypothetical protein